MKVRTPLEVPLNEKRLLSIDEFQTYTGLGKNKALELAKKRNAVLLVTAAVCYLTAFSLINGARIIAIKKEKTRCQLIKMERNCHAELPTANQKTAIWDDSCTMVNHSACTEKTRKKL